MAAGLLLVPPALGDALADRFLVADRRLLRIHRHAVAPLEPRDGGSQMLVADAPQPRLMERLVLVPVERRVFLDQLVEGGGQAEIEMGRESCRARVCLYVLVSEGAV